MRVLGLLMNVGGFLVAVGGLFLTTSNAARALIAVVGIGISATAILVILNKYYLDRAIWKR